MQQAKAVQQENREEFLNQLHKSQTVPLLGEIYNQPLTATEIKQHIGSPLSTICRRLDKMTDLDVVSKQITNPDNERGAYSYRAGWNQVIRYLEEPEIELAENHETRSAIETFNTYPLDKELLSTLNRNYVAEIIELLNNKSESLTMGEISRQLEENCQQQNLYRLLEPLQEEGIVENSGSTLSKNHRRADTYATTFPESDALIYNTEQQTLKAANID